MKKESRKSSDLIYKLGLEDFFIAFSKFFRRNIFDKDRDEIMLYVLNMPDSKSLKLLVANLETTFISLPNVDILDSDLKSLAKGGDISLKSIFHIIKIVKCFSDLKQRDDISNKYLLEYINTFVFPKEILNLISLFNLSDERVSIELCDDISYLKLDSHSEILELYKSLEARIKDKSKELNAAINSTLLQEYLIDRQIHYNNGNLCLLARAGYSSCIEAKVIARSANGYFYIVPLVLERIQSQIYTLLDKIESQLLQLRKMYSKILRTHISFVSYINRQFDLIDNAYARVEFARSNNYEFVKNISNEIILKDYAHPSLNNPVPISLCFDKSLLMITGVNAGGKTMLLKSILSVLFCSNMCIPMKINATHSSLPSIDDIFIIAQDPQDSKNDISTFSGRIGQIATFLNKKHFILGIDEIEIGTDSGEAASLYKVILDRFLENNTKIIITTHHKHLASLMSENKAVQLIAAMYDYKQMKPTFEFTEGIGKSYAMECAMRYGIPAHLIELAKKLHGESANNLERLIDESNEIILKNRLESIKLEKLKEELEQSKKHIEAQKDSLREEFNRESLALKRHYNEAIKEIKMLAKQSSKDSKANIHRMLNKANHVKNEFVVKQDSKNNKTFSKNDWVIYHNKIYKITDLSNNTCNLESQNGFKLKSISTSLLKPAKKPNENTTFTLVADIKPTTKIDLHGMTREEALESLELFLNNAIMARFSEVLVVYGLGNGILKRMVRDFLDKCKYIRGYTDAPADSGGSGASVVYL